MKEKRKQPKKSKSSGRSRDAPTPASSYSQGMNARLSGYCCEGDRKYMEDAFSVAFQQTEDDKDLHYAFFGIFDGHGGPEAALFAKEHLMDFIVEQELFWSDNDDDVLKSIHEGYLRTHQEMWKELENWPLNKYGLPSTVGTTASIAIIKRGKIFVGHVGDSAIILGEQDPNNSKNWIGQVLTKDHKPESPEENSRIEKSGGKVVSKSGISRVVWKRPKIGHTGPVYKSTPVDEIPFLNVARSLGDFWSYNAENDVFVVSPEPDTSVYPIDVANLRCLILATDGVWNVMNPSNVVNIACNVEKSNEQRLLNPSFATEWINPSKSIVDRALDVWQLAKLKADNITVVTVIFDPPVLPKAQVLKRRRELPELKDLQSGRLDFQKRAIFPAIDNVSNGHDSNDDDTKIRKRICIRRRFPNSKNPRDVLGYDQF